MKLLLPALGCALVIFSAAGCENMRTAEMSASPWGKPVVELASVSDSRDTAREITPQTPFETPAYPPSLLQGGAEGYVDVKVHVNADGSVKDAAILKSTYSGFESSVVKTVKTWRFPDLKPATSNDPSNQPSEIELVCRIRFSIQQSSSDYVGAGVGNSRRQKGDMSGSPSREHEMSGR